MFNIGPLELMLILLIALVVVGPARLPEVGRSIGKGLREFRKVQDEVRDSINFNFDEPVYPAAAPAPRPSRAPESSSSPAATEDPARTTGSVREDAGVDSEDDPHATEAPNDPHDRFGVPVDPAAGASEGSTPSPETSQE